MTKEIKKLVRERMIKLNNTAEYGIYSALIEAKKQIAKELNITIK